MERGERLAATRRLARIATVSSSNESLTCVL